MKICLVNLPNAEANIIKTGRWVRKSRGNQAWYPVWLAYCHALLEKYGHECYLLDASVENLSLWETTKKIKVFNPSLIVAYWTYDTYKSDLSYADFLAEIYDVILVGPWSYCLPDALKSYKNLRMMTYGEFEHTVLDYIQKKHYSDVDGLIWKNHITGELVRNKPRPLCSSEELNNLWVTEIYNRHLDLLKYRQTSLRYPFVDLFTARGCPHRCSYCVWIRAMQGGPNYRTRSMDDVMEELYWVKTCLMERKYSGPRVKQIFFQDDTLPPKRAVEVSQAILDRNLNICWGGYSRAEQSYETLKLMKESGCRTLHVGYEKPIQKYLDIIHKDITVEQMEEFAANIKKLGMWTSATFMIFPWESKEDIKFTIEWCKKIKPKRMNFIQAQAYPNTPYAKTVEEFSERYKFMSSEEMEERERWGFKQFYLYNPSFCWEILKHPHEWRNVLRDARGLLHFLRA